MTEGDPFMIFGSNRHSKTLAIKQHAKAVALQNGGMIKICRLDRETKEWVTDEITWDMPVDEIIL